MSGVTNTGLGGTQPVSGTVAVSTVGGTVAVSGTVAVTQSTSPWVTQDAADGTSGATVPTKIMQVGGSFTPGIGANQLLPLKVDSSGQLYITVNGTLPISGTVGIGGVLQVSANGISNSSSNPIAVNLSDGTNGLGTFANYGTSPGAVKAAQVNAFVTNTVAVSGTVAATQSGNWTSRIVGNTGAILDFAGQNAAAPANSLLVAGEFNTTPTTITTGNASPLQLDSAGNLLVNVKTGGTAGTQYVNGAAQATPTGTVALGYDGANVRALLTDSTGALFLVGGQFVSSSTKDGAGNGITSNSTTTTSTRGLDMNIRSILNTAPTTAGFLDIKGADGNVFVRQATASNLNATVVQGTAASLNATVVGTGTFAVQAAQSGNWTDRIVGNTGATLDVAIGGATAATNALQVGGVYNTSSPALTNGQGGALQLDSNANLKITSNGTGTSNSSAAAWTSATALNSVLSVYASSFQYETATITLSQAPTGTLGAGAATFEVSNDNVNWMTITGSATLSAGTGEIGMAGFSPFPSPGTVNFVIATYSTFQFNVAGWQYFRVRLSTAITGTGTITVGYALTNTSPKFTPVNLVSVNGYNPSSANGQMYVNVGSILGATTGTIGMGFNLTQIGGSLASTAAGGSLRVGITGNAAATLDSTIGAATAPTNAIATSNVYQSTVPTLTAGQAVAMQCDTSGSTYVNREGRKATYTMCTGTFTPKASSTSPTWSIQGSASKTIRISRIIITNSGTTGTATPFFTDLRMQKFSALTGGVTGSTPTGSKNDSTNAAQTAICLVYSTVPSTATVIGGITREELVQVITASATVNGIQRTEWDFGDNNQQAAVLRGTAEYYGIVIPTLAAAAPICAITVEWTEE